MMKTKTTEPLYLNLYNFDSVPAEDSPYVLTSPRSLEACRKAGLKPVELLHKSLQDYQEDLEGLDPEKVFQLYTLQEQDRISNLDICRLIRNDLLLRKQAGSVLTENSRPSKSIKRDVSLETSSRKTLLDKENTSRAKSSSSSCESVKATLIVNTIIQTDELLRSFDQRKRVLSIRRGQDSNGLTTGNGKVPNVYSSKCSKQSSANNKKCYAKRKAFPAGLSFAPPLSLSPDNSTVSYTSSVRFTNQRRSTATNCSKENPAECNQKRNKVSHNTKYRSSKVSKQLVGKDALKNHSINCDSNNNNNNNSSGPSITVSSVSQQRKKHVSFRYVKCADDLSLSEHDRRILESMALKKELELENEEFAFQAHRLWEQDREQRIQLSSAQEIQWREYVAEKRRLENERNTQKWEEMKTSLRKSQWLLEQNLKDKDERSKMLKKKMEENKMLKLEDRSFVAAKRRAEVEASNQQMELEAALWQHSLDQLQKQKLERAENKRSKQRETYRRRVASANRVEELRHQDRWQQVREETEGALRDLRELCRLRESKAHRKYDQIVSNREMHLKELSVERALKLQQAKCLQDELERGLEKWQDQVLTLQWASTQRAGYNASRQQEVKRQRVEAENRARDVHHHKLMERICREDEARIKYVRQLISHKEEKMRRMAHNRDKALQESRIQAHTTAELREHIRRTLSPETFDRKVARVALEMRVASRPPTASPTMNRSHIFLG